MAKKVVIAGACRTAIGKMGGVLSTVPAVDMGSIVIKEALKRAGVPADQVDHVYMGCVIQAGLGQNVARQASLNAGLPIETPAVTVNVVCGSGLNCVNMAAQMIQAGDADIVVAGGMESMSMAPFALPKARFGYRMNNGTLVDTMVNDALTDAFNQYHMGITAENVAEQWHLTREELDEFSANSQQKATAAIEAGKFKDEIVPVEVKLKKKTVVVLLSLATSLSVFYCLTTIISSQGERTVLPNYWNADFIVQNQTQTTENINSLKPAIEDSFVEKIEKMDGMKDIHLVEGVPISFPYVSKGFSDMWITNYIERTPYVSSKDVITNYKTNPSNYYGMLIGIDEDQFDYVNQSLSSPVDKQDFLNGKSCIVQYEGSEIPKEYLNQKVPFSFDGKQYEITVEAVSYETQYSGRDIGASLIVSQNYLKSLTSKPTILDVYIYYNQKYDEVLEKKITSLINNSPYSNDLYVESQYENMKTIQEAQGNMMEIGTIIALLLLFVGVLNYANTIASGIQNRRLIFSVMESIGMSRKQINQLLIREGILYAIFSIFVTLTIGSAITYVCFQSMNYMRIPFKVPVIPLISSIILVVLICMLAPLLSYKKLGGNHSIVERLRNCE